MTTATHDTTPVDVEVPDSHHDLLDGPVVGVLTTMLPDGQPQASLVWVDYDGACARVNTALERPRGRDLLTNPQVSLLIVDPDDTSRFVQVRGDAELVTDGAGEHLDERTRRYMDHPAYYGCIYPGEQRGRETRLACRIHARRVTLDAIHR